MNGHLSRHGCTIGSRLGFQQRCHAKKTHGCWTPIYAKSLGITPGALRFSAYATVPRPCLATSDRSLSEAPWGCFSPRSHWLMRPVVTLRWRANTAWLAPSFSRRLRISSGAHGRQARIVEFPHGLVSITLAAYRPSAVSWIEAITGLRHCYGTATALLRHCTSPLSACQSGPHGVRFPRPMEFRPRI